MKAFIRKIVGRLGKNESGSFTLEASLLFPIILILTICLIYFSLVIYEKVALHQRAQLIADRMAYVWGNSTKDPVTGAFTMYTSDPRSPDGLYWQLFEDNFLSKFGLDFGRRSGNIAIGSHSGGSLPDRKLSRAPASWLPAGASGHVKFENDLTGGKIEVELKQPLSLPDSVEMIFGINRISTQASASINDPVEFIRDTDLVFHYAETLSKGTAMRAIKIFKRK